MAGTRTRSKSSPPLRRRPEGSEAPWWLAARDEVCPHCGAGYAYEVEVRCVDCDDAMCWFCVTWSGQHAHCPGCAGGGA